ncbi:hypothetical protein [Pseudoduganella danionis]|uniref:hypothetical protein n=1 Tax=Pseudoduganella danionis TaxID=1890295 RepID=UPI0035B08617
MKQARLVSGLVLLVLSATVCAQEPIPDQRQCRFIQGLMRPIDNMAKRKFKRSQAKVIERREHTLVYELAPDPAIYLNVVLGEHNRVVIAQAYIDGDYLKRHKLTPATIRKQLGIPAGQSLPAQLACDIASIDLIGGDNLESLVFDRYID